MAETAIQLQDRDWESRTAALSSSSKRQQRDIMSNEVFVKVGAGQGGRRIVHSGAVLLVVCVASCFVAPGHSATLDRARFSPPALRDAPRTAGQTSQASLRESHSSSPVVTGLSLPLVSTLEQSSKKSVASRSAKSTIPTSEGHQRHEPNVGPQILYKARVPESPRDHHDGAMFDGEHVGGRRDGLPATGAFAELENVAQRSEGVTQGANLGGASAAVQAHVPGKPEDKAVKAEPRKPRKAPVAPQVRLEPAFVDGKTQVTNGMEALDSNSARHKDESGAGADGLPKRSSFSVALALSVALLAVVAILLLVPWLLQMARHGVVRLRGKGKEAFKRRTKYSDADEYDPTIANLADVEDGFERAS